MTDKEMQKKAAAFAKAGGFKVMSHALAGAVLFTRAEPTAKAGRAYVLAAVEGSELSQIGRTEGNPNLGKGMLERHLNAQGMTKDSAPRQPLKGAVAAWPITALD